MVSVLVSLILLAQPDPVQNPAVPPPTATATATATAQVKPFVPYQGHLVFQAMLVGPARTLGVDAYVGRTWGLAHFDPSRHGAGSFFGLGLHSNFGATESDGCRPHEICTSRITLGPSVRAGSAWSYLRDEDTVLPDGYVYAELSPFLGHTSIADAPLVPGENFLEAGVKLGLGVNLVGWTRLATSGIGSIGGSSGDSLYALILWLALALTNHFEIDIEASRGIDGPLVRGGFAVGSGF